MHSDAAALKPNSNESELVKKKCSFLDYFFFIDPWSWFICMYFCPDCSTLTKQDSRCRHTYVYNVHKLSLLSTTLQAVYSEDMLIEMRQKAFFGRFNVRINYFWTFLWRTSNLILRPIKPSSLKLKKSRDFHAGVSR